MPLFSSFGTNTQLSFGSPSTPFAKLQAPPVPKSLTKIQVLNVLKIHPSILHNNLRIGTLQRLIHTVVRNHLSDNALGCKLRLGVEHGELFVSGVPILLKYTVSVLGPLMHKVPARLTDSLGCSRLLSTSLVACLCHKVGSADKVEVFIRNMDDSSTLPTTSDLLCIGRYSKGRVGSANLNVPILQIEEVVLYR